MNAFIKIAFAVALMLASASTMSYAQSTSRSLNDDLMYRISFGRAEDVKALLEKGAETNIYGGMGETPMTLAIARGGSEADEMIKALLAKGADPNFPDKSGVYPLEHALKAKHVAQVKYLIEGGADIHNKVISGQTLVDIANKSDVTEIKELIAAQLKKEAENEAKMHDPHRLLSVIHNFTTSVCEFTYWNNYLSSQQNPADNDLTTDKIRKSKEMSEKVGQDIATYFPNVKLNTYITYASGSITNQFKALKDNNTRAANGIGTDDDAHRRCKPIADATRDSIEKSLGSSKPDTPAVTR